MRNLIRLALFVCLCNWALSSQAQKIIRGIIIDPDGVGLPGVTVTLPGTRLGTQTDFSGKFKLSIPVDAPVDTSHIQLTATYTGFSSLTLEVGNANAVSAVLATNGYRFPWPPPNWSAAKALNRGYFSQCHTLNDVDVKLSRALSEAGYSDQHYFRIPGGYIVVTKLEQIDEEGKPLKAADRWKVNTATPCFTLVTYLKALLFATPGYFRVTAFAVTDQELNGNGHDPTRDQFSAWLGGPQIPRDAQGIAFSGSHRVTALIYEFKKPENSDALFLQPSEVTADQHLNSAGLIVALSANR